jgi:4-hydroxybenzoyl-CoA thioesterase/acyl-CoA thioester hydrolase
MSKVFLHPRRVEFCETDAAGIAHFSALLQYAEQAEHALLRSLGFTVLASISAHSKSSAISWPRVRIESDFLGAARFEDELIIEVRLARLGNKSITYNFVIRRNEEALAKISFTNVCVQIDDAKNMESIPIPAELRARLSAYLIDDV